MIHRFGIRHHGPGSARSLLRAFDALEPDCVLIEGPPDADDAIVYAAQAEMRPPVALLVWAAADPARAVFFPFARFSPEWVALHWALGRGVPVRFIDLPVAVQLGQAEREEESPQAELALAASAPDEGGLADPLQAMAAAAGYAEVDLFWERLVETAPDAADPLAIFERIEHAMRAARARAAVRPGRDGRREARREAYMRQRIREAEREGFQRVAVVVGAWHAPELALERHTAKADQALLRGLGKTRTEVAWIPWTSARLAAASGYGAGVAAPGWYAHLFEHGREPTSGAAAEAIAEECNEVVAYRSVATAWAVKAARLLREQGIGDGPAAAVEVVRTADALAVMRGLAAAGLDELREALVAAACGGEERRLERVRHVLEVGDELGEVPDDAPQTPLRRDVAKEMRRLRLAVEPKAVRCEWDLRRDIDRARVAFVERLAILGVPFGERLARSGEVGRGTFIEVWRLAWDPAFEVELAVAARWGNDLESAATAVLFERATRVGLGALADDLERALAGRLDAAVGAILGQIGGRAAATSDVLQLGQALPGLARVMRYSDVKATERAALEPVFEELMARFSVGLSGAVRAVDDEGARRWAELVEEITLAVALIGPEARVAAWHEVLAAVADGEGWVSAHGLLVAGRATRMLVDGGVIDGATLRLRAGLALGAAVEPPAAAAWIEGLVRGAGVLLEHQEALIGALDGWLGGLTPEAFTRVLPVVRRAFSELGDAERRRLSARVVKGKTGAGAAEEALDPARVAGLRPVLTQIYRPEEGGA